MEPFRILLGDLWCFLPLAGLANEYHPCTKGGVIPVPFIQTQKILTETPACKGASLPVLEEPRRSLQTYMQGHSSLPMRDRALICLRSAHLSKARHLMPCLAAMAIDHGLRSSDVQLISHGHLAQGWSRRDRLLICATDDVFRHHGVSQKLWKNLSRIYHQGQIFDLVLCTAAFQLCP